MVPWLRSGGRCDWLQAVALGGLEVVLLYYRQYRCRTGAVNDHRLFVCRSNAHSVHCHFAPIQLHRINESFYWRRVPTFCLPFHSMTPCLHVVDTPFFRGLPPLRLFIVFSIQHSHVSYHRVCTLFLVSNNTINHCPSQRSSCSSNYTRKFCLLIQVKLCCWRLNERHSLCPLKLAYLYFALTRTCLSVFLLLTNVLNTSICLLNKHLPAY